MFSVLVIVSVVLATVECLPLKETGHKCGVVASPNVLHQSPWTVFLEYLQEGKMTRTRCGGTLIDSRHVVTAAHCIKHPVFDTLKARLGEYNIENGIDCIDGVCTDKIVIIRVKSIAVHPAYDGKEHDIALLTLEEDAPYTDFIRPACLPTGTLQADAKFIAAGWGVIPRDGDYSHIKKSITLPLFDIAKCQMAFGDRTLPKNVICAGGESGSDTCSGDSGGPLVWMKERAELWGVISSGSPHCGTMGVPGIYTKVVEYLEWISSETSRTKV